MVVGLLGNKSPGSNRFTLVTPKPENGVRLQAKLGHQNPTGLPVGAVSAYEKEDGQSPVEDFINGLDVKMRAKMYGLLSILQEKGNTLREPYSKHLDDGIFELRCKVGNNITRVLYFFYYEGKIILTNGFVKKTQKTPPEEIRLAKERRADYIERMG